MAGSCRAQTSTTSPNRAGVTDILAATQGFIGVLPTDVIVVEPTVTVVVRDGEPIWRGEWFDGGRGFLLEYGDGLRRCRHPIAETLDRAGSEKPVRRRAPRIRVNHLDRQPHPEEPAMATKDKASDAFTAEEKAAMREHVKAEKAAARKAAKGETDLEPEVLAKIAELPEPDRTLGDARPRDREGRPRRASRRGCTTGCPRSPRTARCCASSSPRASSRRATGRSGSTMAPCWTTARCGRPRGR